MQVIKHMLWQCLQDQSSQQVNTTLLHNCVYIMDNTWVLINPFTPKNSLISPLTVYHIVLMPVSSQNFVLDQLGFPHLIFSLFSLLVCLIILGLIHVYIFLVLAGSFYVSPCFSCFYHRSSGGGQTATVCGFSPRNSPGSWKLLYKLK